MNNNYMTIFYVNDTTVGYVGTYTYKSANITISPNESKADVVVDLIENDYADHIKKYPRTYTSGESGSTFNYLTYFCNIFFEGKQVFFGVITNKNIDIKTKKLTINVAWFIQALSYKTSFPDGIFNNAQRLGILGKILESDKFGATPYQLVITQIDTFKKKQKKSALDLRAELRASGMLTAFKNAFPNTHVIQKEIKIGVDCNDNTNKKVFVFLEAGNLLKTQSKKKFVDISDTDNFVFDVNVEPQTYSIRPRGGVFEVAGVKDRLRLNDISNPSLLPELPAPYIYGITSGTGLNQDILNDYKRYANTLSAETPSYDKTYIQDYPEWESVGKNISPLFDDVLPVTTTDPPQSEIDDAVIELAEKSAEWLINEEVKTDITTINISNDRILDFEIGDIVKITGQNRELISQNYRVHSMALEKTDLAKLIEDSAFDVDETFRFIKDEPNEFYVKDVNITIDENGVKGSLSCNKNGVFSDSNLTTFTSNKLAKDLKKNSEYYLVKNDFRIAFYEITIEANAPTGSYSFYNYDVCRTDGYIPTSLKAPFQRSFNKWSDADWGDLPVSKIPDSSTVIEAPVRYKHYGKRINDKYNGFVQHVYDNTLYFDCNQGYEAISNLYWKTYPEDTDTIELIIIPNSSVWDSTQDLTFKVMIIFGGV